MKLYHEFIPKSFLCFRKGYSFSIFKKDLLAGITVGIISIPLAMAFAIASGTTPDRGLFTAIVAGFLISALGGSRVQIGGPTGAFVVLIYGIVQKTGYEGLVASTLIAAVILVLLGVFRLGSWIKYVPHPLITGFTTGLAVIIFSTQIKDFFGLEMGDTPVHFLDKWIAYFHAFPTFDLLSSIVGFATLALIISVRVYAPKIPWGIAAIVVSTLICWVFDLPVATVQSKFGKIPHCLPSPHFPSLSIPASLLPDIFMNGFSLAFLGAIESLLCCVIADEMIGGRHKSNCELVGQGIANFASMLFGGLPATGAIARTAASVKSGAETPVAGMIHAATLFMIILFFSPAVSRIPLAALSAVLMIVAWNMSELSHFISLFKSPAGDIAILAAAFLLTVFVDITVAITFGMVLASFVFMKRMSSYTRTIPLTEVFQEQGGEFLLRNESDVLAKKAVPKGVEVYEMLGPFFFGAADLLKDLLSSFRTPPKVFILRMRHVPMVDASGMHALKEFLENCRKKNTFLLLSGIHGKTRKELEAYGFVSLIGHQYIFSNIDDALVKAAELASNVSC